MLPFVQTLYSQMTESLRLTAFETENILQQAEQACHIIETSLRELREHIIKYTFSDRAEEISFFKKEKPLFLKEFIYFLKVFYVESNHPMGDPERQKAYLKQNLEIIHAYFQRNSFLYTYYQAGKTYLDHLFFLRNAEELPLLPAYSVDNDPRFSTVYSYKLSKLQAFEQLRDYLYNKLSKPACLPMTGMENDKMTALTWTASKAELIELAYALQSSGTFNFGKVDVKQVMTALENSFNIRAGNFYRVFQGQRIRKKSRTIFLDALKQNLIKRMDDSDLNPKTL